MFWENFHFMRPFWLLLLLVLPLLPWMWRRLLQRHSGWEPLIPSPLLMPLVKNAKSEPVRLNAAWPMLLILIASVALAGPSWRRAPTPLQEQNDSLVVVMDLSQSMLASDVKPNRLVRVKQKLQDLLKSRQGAFTALVVYAGDAHVVTPLTDDNRTIVTMLPALEPSIMPLAGHRADLGVAKAIQLIRQGAPGPGHILLVTDKVSRKESEGIVKDLKGTPYRLDALVVGTQDGAPIPRPDGQGFEHQNGNIVMSKASFQSLENLTAKTGGHAHRLTLNDTDLRDLGVTGKQSGDFKATKDHLHANLWKDDGYWLLWLLLPLGLLCWRRGALLLLPLILFPLLPQSAHASVWENLWQRPDQQGYAVFRKHPAQAAKDFKNPAWKGAALYRAGQYEAAAKAFADAKGPQADYNRGNALAHAGHLQKAIDAYDAALKAKPDLADAKFNKSVVEKLLKKQKQQQKQKQKQKNQQRQNGQSGKNGQKNQRQGGQGKQKDQPQHSNGDQGNPNQNQNSGSQHQQGQNKNNNQSQSQASKKDQQNQKSSKSGDQKQKAKKDQQQKGSQAQAEAGKKGKTGTDTDKARAGGSKKDNLSQSDEQWLRMVPDDPSGLLRRKFLYQYQQQQNNP